MDCLTPETVPAYVAQHLDKIDVFAAGATLSATEIHGGNLNYAFRVQDQKGNAVFVKQAPDFIKVFGKEAKLHRERLQLEVDVYTEWTTVLGKEEAARFLPVIHHVDLDNMVFIMDFLGSYQLLDKVIFEGSVDVEPLKRLGEFMGLVHAKTHSSVVGKERAETLTKTYENRKLRDIQLQYVFTKAFEEADAAAWLRADAAFMAELEEIRGIYNGKNEGDLALLHGDLHPGSVMVDSEGNSKVIDPEFCIYGPPGLDIGSLISGYVLAYVYHAAADPSSVLLSNIRSCIDQFWEMYSLKAREAGLAESIITGIGEDAVAFTMCEVARTTLGFAGVRGLPVEGNWAKARSQEGALRLAHRCLMGRKGKGMMLLLEELESYAREAAKEEVEMKVSHKHGGTPFYTRTAEVLLKGTDEKPPVKILKISALGEAVSVASDVATSLEKQSLGKIVSILTSYPELPGNSGKTAARHKTAAVKTSVPKISIILTNPAG